MVDSVGSYWGRLWSERKPSLCVWGMQEQANAGHTSEVLLPAAPPATNLATSYSPGTAMATAATTNYEASIYFFIEEDLSSSSRKSSSMDAFLIPLPFHQPGGGGGGGGGVGESVLNLSPVAVGLSGLLLLINTAISVHLELALHYQLLIAAFRYPQPATCACLHLLLLVMFLVLGYKFL